MSAQRTNSMIGERPISGAAREPLAPVQRAQAFSRFIATDRGLASAISAALFVCAAWPLLLVDTPPYQDLPNHLAAAHILEHSALYPEFVANGFFKTNAALFAWLHIVGKQVGLAAAARTFSALVLSVGAWVYPRFLLEFGGRSRLKVGALFLFPMVHNWFVSKGMLDFALGVPLSLGLLILFGRQLAKPSHLRSLALLLLSICTWYAHGFCLIVVCSLAVFHLLVVRRDWLARAFRTVALPLVPAVGLTGYAVLRHVTEPGGAMAGYVDTQRLIVPWELVYNLWAEWCAGFTSLSMTSALVSVGGLWGILRWRKASPVFFGPAALLLLAGVYVFAPYTTTNWFHVNSRLIPYLWMGLLLRLPDAVPLLLRRVMYVGAVAYSLGMGRDFQRLEHDRQEFVAGTDAVPVGARLLPLIFEGKATSETTRSLEHAWGFYVVARMTSAPLLFSHSRSFPLMYREPPTVRFNHLVLERFASTMGHDGFMCNMERNAGIFTERCEEEWQQRWDDFWNDATPRFDSVLLWEPTVRILSHMPGSYRQVFHQGKLFIYARAPTRSLSE
jgi:hypothetical protein